MKHKVVGGLGLGSLESKDWALFRDSCKDLGRKERLYREKLLLQNMGRMNGVRIQGKFLLIGCQICGGIF